MFLFSGSLQPKKEFFQIYFQNWDFCSNHRLFYYCFLSALLSSPFTCTSSMLKGKVFEDFYLRTETIWKFFHFRFIKPGFLTNKFSLPTTISCCNRFEENTSRSIKDRLGSLWKTITSLWTKYGLQTRLIIDKSTSQFEIVPPPDNSVIETEQLL